MRSGSVDGWRSQPGVQPGMQAARVDKCSGAPGSTGWVSR